MAPKRQQLPVRRQPLGVEQQSVGAEDRAALGVRWELYAQGRRADGNFSKPGRECRPRRSRGARRGREERLVADVRPVVGGKAPAGIGLPREPVGHAGAVAWRKRGRAGTRRRRSAPATSPRQWPTSKPSPPPGRRKFSWVTTTMRAALSRGAQAVVEFQAARVVQHDGVGVHHRRRGQQRSPSSSSAAAIAGLTGRSRNMPVEGKDRKMDVRRQRADLRRHRAAVPPGKRGSTRSATRRLADESFELPADTRAARVTALHLAEPEEAWCGPRAQ